MRKKAALDVIKRRAHETVAIEDQAKFIEILEIELMSLHEGNIARFRFKKTI